MGLFSDTKQLRDSKTLKDDNNGAAATTSNHKNSRTKSSKGTSSTTRVTGGGMKAAAGDTKRYTEDDCVNYIRRVGKLNTTPVVIRGIVSKQLKSRPETTLDDMLQRVKARLS